MKMSLNGNWFSGPYQFDLKSGTKTNVKRALSGKLWTANTPGRDSLVLHFRELRFEDANAIVNWLYENTSKGWKNDADAIDMFFERQEPLHSEFSLSYENGFKGLVRLNTDELTMLLGKDLTQEFTIPFEIINYAPF